MSRKKQTGKPEVSPTSSEVIPWQGPTVETYIQNMSKRTGYSRELIISTILFEHAKFAMSQDKKKKRGGTKSAHAAASAALVTLTAAEKWWCEAEGVPFEEFLARKRGM